MNNHEIEAEDFAKQIKESFLDLSYFVMCPEMSRVFDVS